ncbi:tetratricopeptide repeat protein, partial [bacterium]|nr:tetratricopeptide repeat protein [bacterium]
ASKSPSKNDIYNNAVETIFSSQDDLQAAISSIDKILLQSPSNTTLRRLKAKMLTQLNRNDEAIKEYSYILASKEDNESIYAMYKLLELKNMQEKDILKKIYGSNSNNLEKIYTELANIFEENNDIRNAQLFAEKLTKKFPDNVDGYILLSDIYRRQGKLQESYKVLQTVRDKADNNEAISKYNVLLAKLSDEPVKEADALMNNGLYKQALSVLEGANQENLYVILSSARANYFLNNKQKAFELLNKAMSFYPNNADVFYYFACIFYQEKDIDSARKYLDQVFKLSPNHAYGQHLKDAINKLDADQYVNQILETMEMQNYTEAMRLVNEAISINAKDSNLYYYKGMIYISMNNYSAATAPLYKALQLNPNNSGAYYYLAMAFDNLSEKAQALSYYKKFLASLSSDQYGESEKINYAKSRIQKLQQ